MYIIHYNKGSLRFSGLLYARDVPARGQVLIWSGVMRENESGRSSSRNEHNRDAGFEVQNAYAEVKKYSIFHSGKWYRGLIHWISMHRAEMLMKKPFECGDKVELVMHFAA